MMRVLVLLVSLLFLAACSHMNERQPVRSDEAEAAIQLVQSAEGRWDALARADLVSALGIFERLDDRSGRWSACSALAEWSVANHDVDTATDYAHQAFELAQHLQSSQALYVSALQLGQLTNDEALLLEALPHVESELQKAVLQVLLNNHEAARQSLSAYETSADDEESEIAAMAFVLYRLGKHDGNKSMLLSALDHYRLVADGDGVTDALFLLATLEASSTVARDYATRALLSARQSGRQSRVDAIERWLSEPGVPQ